MPAPDFKHLSVQEVNGVAVVDFVNSQLMFTTEVVEEVGDELSRLVAERGSGTIVLDFTHVQYLSSTMLAHLAKAQRDVEQAKGHLRICCLGPILRDAFRIGHFERLFAIYDDLKSALKSAG
jgi:anti-sigma B factor antagonist